jgi:hypothetical protein
MSQKIQTIIIDDLDGHELAPGQGRTIEFAFDGTSYTIDLSDKNAAAFEKAISKYVGAGTKLGRGRGSVTPMRRSKKNDEIDNQAVRSWAESNGYEVSSRGRIKAEIVEAFREAMA